MSAPTPNRATAPAWTQAWWEATTANPAGYRDASPTAVRELTLQAAQHGASFNTEATALYLVDVREPDEYVGELGHVPEAGLVPLATVAGVAGAWPRDALVVCLCRSGGRSGKAALSLQAMGFTKVVNMTGGMLAYAAAGLPTTR